MVSVRVPVDSIILGPVEMDSMRPSLPGFDVQVWLLPVVIPSLELRVVLSGDLDKLTALWQALKS